MKNTVLSCDKLVVIGLETPHLMPFLNDFLGVDKHGVISVSSYYKYYYHFTDGSFLQISEVKNGSKASVRYEFNPNHYIQEIVYRVLGAIYFERFSRIDVAIDYLDYDLSGVTWMQTFERGKKTDCIRDGAGRLETLYIGRRESNLMHRIYNKAQERNDKGERFDGLWWRVEAEIKFDKEQMLHPFMNPFDSIVGVLENDYGGLSWVECAKIEYLMNHPSAMARLDAKTKKKYKDLMISTASYLDPSPEEVYKRENDKLFDQLATFENVCLKALAV